MSISRFSQGLAVFAGGIALFLALLAASLRVQADELSAEAAVDGYISNLLQAMDAIKPLYQSDRPSYFGAVEVALSEFVDFKEVARGVMARFSTGPNGATDAQLERFADVFRESLIDFYGSALAGYGGVDYEILPVNNTSADPENNTNVRMMIRADNGTRFEVVYTMFLDGNRIWKLKNLYVEGVNLRRQYHSQFESLMATHNNDIDRVIDAWKSSQ